MNHALSETLADLSNTSADLLQTLSSFNQEQFNTVPFAGSWTAGQVAEHLLKSNITPLLYGKTANTERQPDEKIRELKDLFLNYNVKMSNPEFNTPSNGRHDKEKIITSLTGVYKKAEEAAGSLDLSETCLDFELPGLGKLTGLEWIYFMIYHTQRHTHQLKNISQKIISM